MNRWCVAILLMGLVLSVSLLASPAEPRTAPQVTIENWYWGPHNRWSYQHTRRLFPSAVIRRGTASPAPLEQRSQSLEELRFEDVAGDPMTLLQMLDSTYVDAFIVLHDGRIVSELYFNGMKPTSEHLLMSVSKSFTGSLAGILVERGLLDPEDDVIDYVPEIRQSAYADTTIRQLLDMTVGVRWSEDYVDPSSEVYAQDMSMGWRPRHPGSAAGLHDFLQQTRKEGEHGRAFKYVSANTDLLGWVFERATGRDFAELFSDEIWRLLGVEQDAYVLLDGFDNAIADAGFNVTLRDLPRFGQMHLQHGAFNGRQIVPAEWIDDFRSRGNRQTWIAGDGDAFLSGGSYRNGWWVSGDGAFMGLGLAGQMLYIDPAADVVIGLFSSHPAPDRVLSSNQRLGVQAVAAALETSGRGEP